MTLYEELKARGLIAQVTNEPEISEMINNGKATFYIGFDPTADSLHVGHFMALCLMKRLQMAGNRPIALIGGCLLYTSRISASLSWLLRSSGNSILRATASFMMWVIRAMCIRY